MDAKTYNDGLARLRQTRDAIRKADKALAKLRDERDKQIKALGAFSKAKPERLAPAADLSVKDIVALVPHLAPEPAAETEPADSTESAPPQPSPETATVPDGAAAPALEPIPAAPVSPSENPVAQETPAAPQADHMPETMPEPEPEPEPEPTAAAAPAPAQPAAAVGPGSPAPRELPSIPEGEAGDRWFAVANLRSERPNFTQTVRGMAFLDASKGVLAWTDQRIQLDLGSASPGEILTAVYAHIPDTVERIYITAGDPWHRDAERYRYLKDAVAAWLNDLPQGWQVETGRGKDRMADHHYHERNPVGRWERGDQHVEIRSVAEWFDPDGADVTTVREAFRFLWQALRREWSDVVLMGNPSLTGRDLWSRTIPTKQGARWADGYPVMSDEIRQLLHATAGQGRTELITPPRVPHELPQWTELDRTLAYGKHTWASGVGAPQRVTARTFASWSDKQKTDALFAPSHWQVRVTIPDDWNHVGLLPHAITGDRAWDYPHQPGRTFTTWAGGAEINAALRNPVQPWGIEILDGLLWESGTPLKEWSEKLKKAWAALSAMSQHTGTEQLRKAYKLASRGVRSILLFGLGAFAQRPRTTGGSVPVGRENEIPKGARVTGFEGGIVRWERTVVSRSPWAHPEWAAGVWSAARAALLSTRTKAPDGQTIHVGALHLPPGSIVAFRTDAIYTTAMPVWPYNGEPGDYLLKGHMPHAVAAPTTDAEFFTLQGLGRAWWDEKNSDPAS
ncbi:Mucin-19 [Streptomyces olivoreticuli]